MTGADYLTDIGAPTAGSVDPLVLGGRAGGVVAVVPPEALRRAFRRHAAGVTVVTLPGPGGPVGFTATSVASLSAAPPLVSLSLSASSSCAPAMLAADSLVIHLLSAGHENLARRFATSGVDRFAPPVRWATLPTGEPVLSDVAVWLRARIEHRIRTGESYLVVAQVLESQIDRDDEPLVYHDGRYGTILDLTMREDEPEA
jgi:flavin reductase (DIM6/NTAB) family NADH-FMN oxidoreductase RutF